MVKETQNESESENERYSPTAPDADTNININTAQQQTLEGTSVAPAITLPPVTAAGESALHVGDGAVAQAMTLGPEVVIDIETSGKSVHVDNAAIPLVSITDGPHTITLANAPPLRHILANNNITKIFHNAAFELSFLKAEELTIAYYEDTMLMYQVLCNNEGDGKLSVAAQKFLNVTMDKTLQDAKKWNGQLTLAHVDYNQNDAIITLCLYQVPKERLHGQRLWETYRRELKVLPAPIKLHRDGIALDEDAWNDAIVVTRQELQEKEAEVKRLLNAPHDFNLRSTQKLLELLNKRGV